MQPSIQKLVSQVVNDSLAYISEENVHTNAYGLDIPRVRGALAALVSEFSIAFPNQSLSREVTSKTQTRAANRRVLWEETVRGVPTNCSCPP